MTRAVFIKVANTLKRRAERGPGLTIDEMREAAHVVLETHDADGRERMLAAIADARGAIADWRAGGDRAVLIAKLAKMANEAESQGRVLGNPLLTEVGARLGAFVSLFAQAAPCAKAVVAIALHLDAMIVALDRKGHDAIDDKGRILLTNLELTRRTVKPQ